MRRSHALDGAVTLVTAVFCIVGAFLCCMDTMWLKVIGVLSVVFTLKGHASYWRWCDSQRRIQQRPGFRSM